MASIVPVKPIDKVQFYEDHNSPWGANAVAIGTSAAAVTALQTKTAAARAAWDAHQVAQGQAKAATEAFHNAVAAMAIAGAAIIKQIRAKAEDTGDPNVYTLAVIPSPAIPSPRPAPPKPGGFVVTLDESGTLKLTWKCSTNGGGVIYQVWRRIGAASDFAYLGGTGTKEFQDNTLPAGSSAVTYQIQAARTTAVSPWAQFNVNFGVGGSGSGAMIASVSEATGPTPGPKMAA